MLLQFYLCYISHVRPALVKLRTTDSAASWSRVVSIAMRADDVTCTTELIHVLSILTGGCAVYVDAEQLRS